MTKLEPMENEPTLLIPTQVEPDMSDTLTKAVGAAAITVVVAAGTIVIVAGVLKIVTWIIGGVASFLTAAAPWIAVILGVCAYSAYVK
jgi:hypothetical protein